MCFTEAVADDPPPQETTRKPRVSTEPPRELTPEEQEIADWEKLQAERREQIRLVNDMSIINAVNRYDW